MKTAVINSHDLLVEGHRIDPDLHMSEGAAVRNELARLPYELIKVGDCCERVFLGNIFSRVFVNDAQHGVPYLSASDTVLANLETGRFLSNKQASELNYLRISKDWILVTCSGTLGNVTFTNSVFENYIATHDLIRMIPNSQKVSKGTLFAFLSSRFGYYQITQTKFGGVVKHINDDQAKDILIPVLPVELQNRVENLIQESASLREVATMLQKEALQLLLDKSKLGAITPFEYDYYGPGLMARDVSCFTVKKRSITPTTINAFNLSERIRNLKKRIINTVETRPLSDCIDDKGLFSTGSFPRVEVKPGYGIELINQRDIFDNVVHGKFISKRNVKTSNLVEDDEIIIAGVGTLAESETFCRCVYANEYLKGKLISGEFIRMKTNQDIPSGYLYTWLSSQYGFRLIRNTQAGTKLCRPIPKLLEQIPVPILSSDEMTDIDKIAKAAQNNLAKAAFNELEAISIVEAEIDKWNKQ